jgi:hypothetical protein
MMEAVVNALMSAVDKVAWEQAGLFNTTDLHSILVHLPSHEPLPLDLTQPPASFSFGHEDRENRVRSVTEFPVQTPPRGAATNKFPSDRVVVGLTLLSRRLLLRD